MVRLRRTILQLNTNNRNRKKGGDDVDIASALFVIFGCLFDQTAFFQEIGIEDFCIFRI